MLDTLKMRVMCGVTAAAVVIGSLASPVMVWADDDDDILEDLMNLSDEEIIILDRLTDSDNDGDIDEDDVDAISTLIAVSSLAEADRRYEAEREAQRRAEEAAQAALAAQRSAEQRAAQAEAALAAQRKAEEEARRARVTGVWVSSTDVTLTPGQTYQITAGVKPDSARNRGIRFSTSDWSVASVDGSGVIRGNRVGSCYITATTDDGGYTARTYVRVNPAPAVAAQTIAQDSNWTGAAANLILTAAPGAVINLVAPKALSFDMAMINAMVMRPDVGLLIAYPYNGHVYTMAVPAGYNLVPRMDKNGKVSFLSLAAVKDGKIKVTMVQ